jgi:hypothetical protein
MTPIYHITHVDNLRSIIRDDCLICDAEILARGGPESSIGMGEIKARRLTLPVKCHPGLHVGDMVPFYFCPRSIMLFIIHRGNHEQLAYKGGQSPVLHLEADLEEAVRWADTDNIKWAFTPSNAGAYYAEFEKDIRNLRNLDWDAIGARDFRDSQVKEGKQAEFLIHRAFPWRLVRRIGVFSSDIELRVGRILAKTQHKPEIAVRKDWYY